MLEVHLCNIRPGPQRNGGGSRAAACHLLNGYSQTIVTKLQDISIRNVYISRELVQRPVYINTQDHSIGWTLICSIDWGISPILDLLLNSCFFAGYNLSPQAMNVIMKRFSMGGRITFDEFISCCVKLRALTGEWV